jgi:hypothetical protein
LESQHELDTVKIMPQAPNNRFGYAGKGLGLLWIVDPTTAVKIARAVFEPQHPYDRRLLRTIED